MHCASLLVLQAIRIPQLSIPLPAICSICFLQSGAVRTPGLQVNARGHLSSRASFKMRLPRSQIYPLDLLPSRCLPSLHCIQAASHLSRLHCVTMVISLWQLRPLLCHCASVMRSGSCAWQACAAVLLSTSAPDTASCSGIIRLEAAPVHSRHVSRAKSLTCPDTEDMNWHRGLDVLVDCQQQILTWHQHDDK